MTAQHSIHREGERSPRARRRNGLLQLGWLHFWLLSGILGGMIALAGVVLLAYSSL